jgi:hypothetical protein
LIVNWLDLRGDLTLEGQPIWTDAHIEAAVKLTGLRMSEAQGSRIVVLSKAMRGDFSALADLEEGDLAPQDRQLRARSRLVERIDEEIAALEALYETLDFESIELDRARAADIALFDPSKEASLARRYESEARRGFFKSLKEFHKAEAEEAERLASAPPASAIRPNAQMASSREEPSTDPADPAKMSPEASWPDSTAGLSEFEVVPRRVGRPSRVGRAVSVPA